MKKILLYLLVLILILSGCSINQEGTSYITVKTPQLLTVSNKSINYNGEILDPLLNPSFFRYVLIVETQDGRRIKVEYLKNNEDKVIDLPSGVPLNLFLGVYIAIDENSFTEKFNVFVLSDKKENVMLMANETKLIEFNLDLTKAPKVVSYYGNTFNIKSNFYSVLSATIDKTGNPTFTILPLIFNKLADMTLIVKYSSGTFQNLDLSSFSTLKYVKILDLQGNDPSSDSAADIDYWLISNDKIYRIADIDIDPINTSIANSNYQISSSLFMDNSFLLKTKRVISLKFGTRFYYFFDYGVGFLGFNYGLKQGPPNWSTLKNIAVNFTLNKVRQYPLLIDIKKDIGTDNMIILTKMGAFYSKEDGLKYFSEGDYIKGINSFKKIINISDDKTGNSILITSIISTETKNYIGTRKGVYYIDKNNNYWKDFITSNNTNNIIGLNSKAFTKIDDLDNEIIDKMFLINVNSNDILVVTTPKRILFKNLTNGAKDYLTLNDGLLFVPIGRLLDIVETNNVDFISHKIAPVVDIVNYQNNTLFIATRFGLSSIDIKKLKL